MTTKNKEFADDPMMYELHEIRTEIHERTKDLSPKEKVAWIHKEAEELLRVEGGEHILNYELKD